ncbi:MAG: glycosyltransferase [Cyanobium sp. D14.bin.5]|nr:glycosyltransferase [Cyanobium sp. D14.bin.5]
MMRLVIDMQGAQSLSSRNRGIGRYSIALSRFIVESAESHEVFLLLNGLFPDSIKAIRAEFEDLLSQENFKVWSGFGPVQAADPSNHWRRRAAEKVRAAFLESLDPDAVLITSLFEGYADDALIHVSSQSLKYTTAVILYDLIPFIHMDIYLGNPDVKAWYMRQVDSLRNCDLFLAISDSSRLEAIDQLAIEPANVVTISTDADEFFRKLSIEDLNKSSVLAKFAIGNSFVLYTGGIDHRKNIDRLVTAYSMLSSEVRAGCQLVIVCAVDQNNRSQLSRLSRELGLADDELILTGFISDEELRLLYNLCSLFVFPSWHEGFGLPVLEAMRCGAPTIGSRISSLPEVIGLQEALFDPYSVESMHSRIHLALTDFAYRERLLANATVQSNKFSWQQSAKLALSAIEIKSVAHRKEILPIEDCPAHRALKLAFFSPLPPDKSGIADYSSELLPELSKYYEIVVIVDGNASKRACPGSAYSLQDLDWFSANCHLFDRIVYQFGNSSFHQHMFLLLRSFPGVVVLHDFYLSGVLHYMRATGHNEALWDEELFCTHGHSSVDQLISSEGINKVISCYPSSAGVIQDSRGIIVHSDHSLDLIKQLDVVHSGSISLIPHLRTPPVCIDRNRSRQELALPSDAFIICSFGSVAPTKLNHRILSAWIASALSRHENSFLVFVGQNDRHAYGGGLASAISASEFRDRIRITGWVDKEAYGHYLQAADAAVQLRTQSRGECSGAVLDCMNYGLPTIVNAHGSMANLDSNAVCMLQDDFSDLHLSHALEAIYYDRDLRDALSRKSAQVVRDKHDPFVCATQYRDAIESFYSRPNSMHQAISSVAQIDVPCPSENDLIGISVVLAKTFPV